jgi:hypothetical protein
MTRIVGGIGIAHTPSMGYQYDKGVRDGFDPAWRLWYDGTAPVRAWLLDRRPSHLVIVYNDHMNYFDLRRIRPSRSAWRRTFRKPTKATACGRSQASTATPISPGRSRALIRDGFDLTFCQELELDHGVYSWLPYLMAPPWPVKVLPIAVNMLMHPVPTPERLRALGPACGARSWPTLRRATWSCSRRAECRIKPGSAHELQFLYATGRHGLWSDRARRAVSRYSNSGATKKRKPINAMNDARMNTLNASGR